MSHFEKDKKKRKVQRLVDVEVSHVSLVDKPANQTPFKFVKRDDGTETEGAFPMNITLKNMFGSRQPEITSVMADTERKATELAKMVLDGDKAEITEQDGVFIARKSGTKANENEKVVHLGKSTGIAYTVANLSKELALYDGESMSFGETVQKEGFVPGLYTATEALHTTIRNIAMDEDTKSPQDFNTKVSKALDEFGAFVSDLITALPEQAFKFEKAALGVIAPNDLSQIKPVEGGFNSAVYDAIFGDPNEPPVDGTQKPAENADATGEGAAAPKEADAQADAGTAQTEGGAGTADGDKAEAGAGGEADASAGSGGNAGADAAPSNLEELPKGAEGQTAKSPEQIMAEAMEGLTKNVGEQLAAAIKPLADRMDAQDAAIAKVSKAMGSTVASTPEEDADGGNVIDLSKGNHSEGAPPLMDTAYRSHRQG